VRHLILHQPLLIFNPDNVFRLPTFKKIWLLSYFKVYPPTHSLRSLIRELHVYHIKWQDEKDMARPFITCLANTEQNLYFYINDPVKIVPAEKIEIPIPPVVITGPKFKPVGMIFGDDHLMIKVAFHPTGTFRLLNINMQQTVNAGLDATSFWGEEVISVLKQLSLYSSYDDMIALVCSFIETKHDLNCRPMEPIDDVAIQMLDPQNKCTQEEWASAACLSLRQFERNFIIRIGISPKLFNRIVRFEHVLKLKKNSVDKSWADTAVDCGYTDSSHLFREFKEFAEFPPSNFYLNPTSGYSSLPTG
jgi:AraC-like DNA-binding protein